MAIGQNASKQYKQPKRRRKRVEPPPEQVWVRAFVAFTGTDNVTSFCSEDLGGVSLTRIVETLNVGTMTWSNVSEGGGCTCTFVHVADEADVVEVLVWFKANEEWLEVRKARRLIMEDDCEPNAA